MVCISLWSTENQNSKVFLIYFLLYFLLAYFEAYNTYYVLYCIVFGFKMWWKFILSYPEQGKASKRNVEAEPAGKPLPYIFKPIYVLVQTFNLLFVFVMYFVTTGDLPVIPSKRAYVTLRKKAAPCCNCGDQCMMWVQVQMYTYCEKTTFVDRNKVVFLLCFFFPEGQQPLMGASTMHAGNSNVVLLSGWSRKVSLSNKNC